MLEGLHAGGDDCLFKPVNEEVLCAKIKVYQERFRISQAPVKQNGLLLDYQEQIKEAQQVAREFIDQYTALDKINDPLVRFLPRTADNFSGDLIAVARTPGNRLHVLLADSAGHGLTSALAVIPITQPFYQMTAKGFDIASIVKEINRCVHDYLPLLRYVAAVVTSIDQEEQVIQAWNGGCPDALLFSAGEGGRIILNPGSCPWVCCPPKSLTPRSNISAMPVRAPVCCSVRMGRLICSGVPDGISIMPN